MKANIDTNNTNETITKTLVALEEKLSAVHNFLGRPDNPLSEDIEYKGAFNDYIRSGNRTPDLAMKALHSNEDDGGVMVTPAMHSKIMHALESQSIMRRLASIETISTNSLDLVIEDGDFVSGWIGEVEERKETQSPKLKQKRIHVHELYAQPKASQRLIDDSAIQIEHWLTERLRDSFARAENEAFINGDGKKKPIGILDPQSGIKPLQVDTKITPELLLAMINELKEEYQGNATFLMHRSTLNQIQALKDNIGRFVWQQSVTEPMKQTIFGIPVVCSENMPKIEKASLAIALGDFASGYKIVDRQGISVMQDPYTDKPFVKFYSVKRVGGDVINPDAIKIAKFS